ncbi:MAG: hypothetical protein ABR578_14205 [Chromatocurvus sp.]
MFRIGGKLGDVDQCIRVAPLHVPDESQAHPVTHYALWNDRPEPEARAGRRVEVSATRSDDSVAI